MGFIDKIKQYASKKGKARMALQITMLGARGVGKTSVVTAIFDDSMTKDGFGRTKIVMTAEPQTGSILHKQRRMLMDVFDNRTDIAAIPASSGESKFYFQVGLIENTPCIDLTITDYPGEWLTDEPKIVSEKICNSQVIIIAIDTPYLMENNGIYNEDKNKIALTTKFISENLDTFKNKLVMLVPLKCELYFGFSKNGKRNDRTAEMTSKVLHAYRDMITMLKDNGDTAMMIAPILTVGGVVFKHFEMVGGIPVAKFKFYDGETEDGRNAIYKPRFCAQPIFHLLSFVAQQYVRYRNSVGFFGSFFQQISDFFSDNNEFLLEMEKINEKRIKDGNGYKIICGQDLFFTKNK